MSRSGYSEDLDNLELGRWRGVVASSIRGKRGQKLLRDLIEALDAMPDKELITGELKADGSYCALGAVGARRGINMDNLDPDDSESVAVAFDISEPLAQEIVHLNDEYCYSDTPEERWKSMRKWAEENIKRRPNVK